VTALTLLPWFIATVGASLTLHAVATFAKDGTSSSLFQLAVFERTKGDACNAQQNQRWEYVSRHP
jgi:hypothetical protein